MQMNLLVPNQDLHQMINTLEFRQAAAEKLLGFCLVYLPHYFTLPKADFHPEMFELLGDPTKQFIGIAGFRGSAKSTFAGTALPIYAALSGKAKFIILINDTDDVVKLTIANIRTELEENELLINDYGDLIENKVKNTTFNETNIVLANGCRIMGRSRGQKIRGLRHRQHRPDLVIIDDPEELQKVQKKEYRDKTEQWIKSDIIPATNETKARLIVIGNVLHTDSIMPRLKKHSLFTYRAYPLLDKQGKITWLGKYPDEAALKRQEAKVGHTAWLREYLLKVVPPEGQEIKEEWLQYYDQLPPSEIINHTGVGIDLAISKNEAADYTAMVSGFSAQVGDRPRIYILPQPLNERLSFHETIQQMQSLNMSLQRHSSPEFFVENVGYQKAAIEEAQRRFLPVTPMRAGNDKRARLRSIASFVQDGTVVFPREGCEELIAQLLGFGIEEHDDLVDAFVYLLLGLAQQGLEQEGIIRII